MRRRVIEQFKRALFVQQTTGFNLKNELKKLISGSREMLDLKLSSGEAQMLATEAQEAITAANAKKHGKPQSLNHTEIKFDTVSEYLLFN